MMDDTDSTPIFDRYSKLGYHAKIQKFKSIEQAENYLFEGFSILKQLQMISIEDMRNLQLTK